MIHVITRSKATLNTVNHLPLQQRLGADQYNCSGGAHFALPPPQLTRGSGAHCKLPSTVWGIAPATNDFGALYTQCDFIRFSTLWKPTGRANKIENITVVKRKFWPIYVPRMAVVTME